MPVGGNPPDLAAEFASCITDAIDAVSGGACSGISITQPGSGAVFRVTVPGSGPLQICVGPVGGPADDCCVADANDRCAFNADLVLLPLSELDCNNNLTDDAIDIAVGLSGDCNGNGVPDECQPLAALQAEPTPIAKNRYLSVVGSNAGLSTVIRVTLRSLHHPNPPNLPQFPATDFSTFEGQIRWVGSPSTFTETEVPATTFTGATLQCEPHFMDWSTVGLVHLYGPEIVPSSVYDLQVVAQGCDTSVESNFSEAITVPTARWGDIVEPFQAPSPAALTQPNIQDVAAVVDKFKGVASAPIKARSDLAPDDPDGIVNILDVAAAVDAFKNFAYPYSGPTVCP